MEEKYWKQFENSGRIEDYLTFVNSTGRETDDTHSDREEAFRREGPVGGVYSAGNLNSPASVFPGE